MDTQYKNIFSIRVARKLISLGETVVRISPNFKRPGYTVFTFKVSPTFEEHMKIATAKRGDTYGS